MDGKETNVLIKRKVDNMNKYCIAQEYTLKEAIERIDASKNRVVVVVNNEEKVIGVISQGDIIRALISGKNLYSKVSNIIHPNFLYLNEKNMDQAYGIFKRKNITLLPVVDQDFRLLDIISMDDIYLYMEDLCKN